LRYIVWRGGFTPSPIPFPLEGKGGFEANGVSDFRDDGVEVVWDATAVDAKDAVALASQPFIARQIAQGDIGAVVDAAIDFDHQAGAQAGEVDDVRADRRLAPDADVELAKPLPQLRLAPGREVAKAPGAHMGARPDPFLLVERTC